MNYGRELLKGSTDSILLSLIHTKPMYGYEIIKEIEKKSSGFFSFKEGTLYPALHRMEQSGLVEGRWQRAPGGQERRYYYITEKGRETFCERLETWRGFSGAVNAILNPKTA